MKVAWVDVAQYAHEAGFRGEDHAIVVALSEPESNRESRAHNGADPHSGSFGLLQINGVHLSGGGVCEGWMVDDLYDPVLNLVAAFRVYEANGRSFQPWGAYTSGLHVRWLPTAKCALDGRHRWKLAEAKAAQMRAERDRILAKHDALAEVVRRVREAVA